VNEEEARAYLDQFLVHVSVYRQKGQLAAEAVRNAEKYMLLCHPQMKPMSAELRTILMAHTMRSIPKGGK